MKKVKLFSFALAALMLGACSSEDVIDNGGQPQWNSQGKGYINLAIQLPTQPSTRAANDQFEDGMPSEYDVKDATLILFVNDAVNSAYDMKLNFSMDGSSDNITTTAKITQEINKVESSEPSPKIQALVVLNRNNAFTVEGSDLLVDNLSMKGKSLEDLNLSVSGAIGQTYSWHGNGLLMSNAVMSDAAGGNQLPTDANVVGPLVTIDGNDIYGTKAEADANPAATIYVERAEAKVTMTATDGTVTDGSNFNYTILGWALDNTNKTNKLVRDVDDFENWSTYKSALTSDQYPYRFLGHTEIATNLYRVYWGNDYNYTGISSDNTGLNTIGGAHAVIDDNGLIDADGESPAYCFENTTDLANMLERNLTRVIVKTQFNGGVGFYTVDDNRGKMWTEGDVMDEVAARLLADIDFNKWAYENVKAGETLSSSEDFSVTLSGEDAGQRTVTEITLNDAGKGKLKDGAIDTYPTNAADLANKHIVLNYYAGGVAYYPVYIKHFGDDLTPWTTGAYDTDANFLGRYGMLRNNWYDLKVTKIRSLGDPNVVEVTGDPVDKDESYISVDINVLSWAKRTQEVEL